MSMAMFQVNYLWTLKFEIQHLNFIISQVSKYFRNFFEIFKNPNTFLAYKEYENRWWDNLWTPVC